ncbi:uncharacterized protein LOC125647092 [Ostrea edulis]|uniref:uncharacterized protein LOC125647092 n=1 Tax=Ostrea edulis TaxID=37623 RepID=UPI0024AF70AF|nr:uncharacterized protein LOC125647092 [Ostrea edulis]
MPEFETIVVKGYDIAESLRQCAVYLIFGINAVGGSDRTLKEVKKKWQDVKSSTKKKEVDRLKIQRQTRGGPPPTDIKERERKIVGKMSKSVLCGIPGGCDSLVSEIEQVKESEGAICPVDSAAEQPVVFQNSVDQPASCASRVNGKRNGSSTEKLIEIQQEMLGLMKEDLIVKQNILDTLQEIVTCKKQKLDFIMENATSFYTM